MGLATGMVWDWDGDWTLCGGSLGRGLSREPRGDWVLRVSIMRVDCGTLLVWLCQCRRYENRQREREGEGGRAAHFRLTARMCVCECVCLSWWSVYNFAIVCLSLFLLPFPLSISLSLCCWIRVFPDCFCEARRGVASTSRLTTLA